MKNTLLLHKEKEQYDKNPTIQMNSTAYLNNVAMKYRFEKMRLADITAQIKKQVIIKDNHRIDRNAINQIYIDNDIKYSQEILQEIKKQRIVNGHSNYDIASLYSIKNDNECKIPPLTDRIEPSMLKSKEYEDCFKKVMSKVVLPHPRTSYLYSSYLRKKGVTIGDNSDFVLNNSYFNKRRIDKSKSMSKSNSDILIPKIVPKEMILNENCLKMKENLMKVPNCKDKELPNYYDEIEGLNGDTILILQSSLTSRAEMEAKMKEFASRNDNNKFRLIAESIKTSPQILIKPKKFGLSCINFNRNIPISKSKEPVKSTSKKPPKKHSNNNKASFTYLNHASVAITKMTKLRYNNNKKKINRLELIKKKANTISEKMYQKMDKCLNEFHVNINKYVDESL